ncbi:DUF2267 domain-containing protein [Rhizobium sp. S-51]|uniref:DUF2267 domain-containing protein n=1 Tax=Rhizobium terricola TaxID=2728849 RepID=A0A7Y0ATW1_9HYPH|nr:DUF2267 domain-containing protein [Rhizobium terricola]NML73428.1 DUF2267 domain-containing protein [Rhizobium terricola]
MPMPMEYRQASRDFDAFMEDLRDTSMLQTTHQCYTMLQGVFQVFRRRLTTKQALAFADTLPPVLRALFVSDWDVEEPRLPFGTFAEMTREVKALRPDHNFSTDTALSDVAAVMRRHIDLTAFEAVLAELPPGAKQFWTA